MESWANHWALHSRTNRAYYYIGHKTAKKQDESQALSVKREDLEGTERELDAAPVEGTGIHK